MDSLRSFIYLIRNLKSFRYTDEKKEEKGGSIREKATFIIELVEDSSKLDEERDNYKGWKNRIAGVSQSGSTSVSNYGGVSASGFTNSGKYGARGSNPAPVKKTSKNTVGTNFNPNDFKKTTIKGRHIESSDEESPSPKKQKHKSKKEDSGSDEEQNSKTNNKNIKQEIPNAEKTNKINKVNVNIKSFGKKKEDEEFIEVEENTNTNTNKSTYDPFSVFSSNQIKNDGTASNSNVNKNSTNSQVSDPFDFTTFSNTQPIQSNNTSIPENKSKEVSTEELMKSKYIFI